MEAKANAKFVRISPRKVNVVLDLVRGKDVKYAEAVLKHTPKAACEPLLKLLNSAMANAENNHDMDVSKLYIAQCNATAGPILKRIRPRAQGRAFRINTVSYTHLTLPTSDLIRTVSVSALLKIGIPVGLQTRRTSVLHSLRTITSVRL